MTLAFAAAAVLVLVPLVVLTLILFQSYRVFSFRIGERQIGALAGVAAIMLIAGAALLMRPPAASKQDDPWASWRGKVQASVQSCAKANAERCLAKALTASPAPRASGSAGVVDSLLADLQMASAIMAIPEARDLLWKDFGIDDKTFIGTGYSVASRNGSPGAYDEAYQREYFLPNFCADKVDPKVCPEERTDVWTWQLAAADAGAWLDRPIRDFLTQSPPTDHAAEYQSALARLEASSATPGQPQALIRMARFNPKYYAGTLGRPAAELVFAGDLQQVQQNTLRAVMLATGSASLAGDVKPDENVFVWVYIPAATSEARVASWRAVFDALAQTKPPAS